MYKIRIFGKPLGPSSLSELDIATITQGERDPI